MTTEQIKETIQEFKQAAARAKEAGFDIIELHAAHGYLMHEFLYRCPITAQTNTEDHMKIATAS